MKINFEKAAPYIEALYQRDETARNDFISASAGRDFGMPVDSDVSRMMQLLIRLARPARVLEIGTSIGYSTVAIARAAQEYGGRITTIEYDPGSARQAVKNFEAAGVAGLIEVKIGDAREIVPGLTGSFDLIFQDVGDKRLYPELLEALVKLLRPGGLLLAEDPLLPFIDLNLAEFPASERLEWENSKAALQEFNQRVADCPELQSTLLPIGDGLTVAIKIG